MGGEGNVRAVSYSGWAPSHWRGNTPEGESSMSWGQRQRGLTPKACEQNWVLDHHWAHNHRGASRPVMSEPIPSSWPWTFSECPLPTSASLRPVPCFIAIDMILLLCWGHLNNVLFDFFLNHTSSRDLRSLFSPFWTGSQSVIYIELPM